MPRIGLFLALLLVLVCLSIPAHAEVPGDRGPTLETAAVVGPPEEEGEEGEPEEESPEEEKAPGDGSAEDAEDAEEAEEAGVETSPFPPDECLLRTARARLFDYSGRDRVRLVIRYTSLAPAEVRVGFRLKNGARLGSVKRQFAKKGLFRLDRDLSRAQAAKVFAAKGFTIQMSIPAAPRYCNQYYSRSLTIKRTVKSQVVWFQSDSIFGTG